MDKLKNMMSSNKNSDPSVDNTTGDRTTGEGSHLASSRTTGNDPLSSSTNPTSATGGNLTGSGTHGLSEPHSSRMPGSFDDDAATTASVSSGIPGRGQAGNTLGSGAYGAAVNTSKPLPAQPGPGNVLTGSGLTGPGIGGNTTAGPHSSNLENKIDPRVDSDLDGRSGLGGNTTSSGSGLTGNTGSGRLGSNTTGQGIGSTTDSGRSFPLGGTSNTGAIAGSNTGYQAPGQVGTYPAGGAGPGSTGFGSAQGGNTTAGPHSSNLENKLDPRVDSDRDGRSGLGNTGTGTTGTGYGSGTGPSATAGNSGTLGRDAALGAGAGAGTGAAAGGISDWEHQHGAHGHKYEGDPCGPESAVPGAPHFTTGPHATDTANRLDPHVASGIGVSGASTGTSSGSGLGSSTTSTGHHTGRDAALGAGAGVAGVGAYEAGRDSTQSSSTGPAPNTAGPHKSDVLNKLDPRVDSDLSKQQSGTTGTGVGSSTAGTGSSLGSSTTGTSADPYGSSTTGTGHHTGRDAALAGGAGAGGVGAYEAEKHHHNTQTGTSGLGSSTTAGEPHHSRHQGHHDRQQHAAEHHLGRDAGIAGAGTAGVYEAEKHHHNNQTGTSGLGSSTTAGEPHHSRHQGHHDRQQHAAEHHLGRDAGLTGAGTAGAYEAERHHGHPTQSSTVPSTAAGITSSSRDPTGPGYDNQVGTGHHYGRDAGLVGAGGVGAYEADKHLGHHDTTGQRLAGSNNQPSTTTGAQPTGLTGNTGIGGMQSNIRDPNTTGTAHKNHHLGRDAALGVGAGGAAYEADKHHHNKHDPTTTSSTTGYDSQGHPGNTGHHTGRDAALGAGAVGAGYEADKHHHDKEAKKLEHEREKEEKHQDSGKKSGGILGIFHRDKGDKEAKKEEKAEEKAERKHNLGGDTGLGAGAATTGHEYEKHQHTHGRGDEETAAGAGATGLESDLRDTNLEGKHHHGEGHAMAGSRDHEHGSQAGVHDSAISSGSGVAGIGGGPTTHDAYGEQDPHRTNRLHKEPPAKVLEQRGASDGRQL